MNTLINYEKDIILSDLDDDTDDLDDDISDLDDDISDLDYDISDLDDDISHLDDDISDLDDDISDFDTDISGIHFNTHHLDSHDLDSIDLNSIDLNSIDLNSDIQFIDSDIDEFLNIEKEFDYFYNQIPSFINIYHCYIENNIIVYINNSKISLNNGILSKEILNNIIINNLYEKKSCKYYQFKNILKYNLYIDNDNIKDLFLSNKNTSNHNIYFTKIYNIIDIKFKDTIYILQDFNALYIFYQNLDIDHFSIKNSLDTDDTQDTDDTYDTDDTQDTHDTYPNTGQNDPSIS